MIHLNQHKRSAKHKVYLWKDRRTRKWRKYRKIRTWFAFGSYDYYDKSKKAFGVKIGRKVDPLWILRRYYEQIGRLPESKNTWK